MKRAYWLSIAAVIMAVGLAALGLAAPARAITGDRPEFRKLAEDVYAYVGKRNDANALVIITSQGVVIADTGNNPSDTREISKDIAALTKQPVRFVVITQNHGDHIGGTPLFSPPATVIVQDRVARHWAEMKPYEVASWRKRFPERAEALKTVSPLDTAVSFSDHMSLHLGGKDIELMYVDDVYNPGDVAVWLPEEGVLHASFAGYIERNPDIRPDYSHGTTAGMLKQLDAYIALKPKIVVPAHGPVGGAKDLEAMMDYLLLARQKVRAMIDRNMTLPAIEHDFNVNEYKGWDRTEYFVRIADTIYRELQGEGPQIIKAVELRADGTVAKAEQDGRLLTIKADDGKALMMRVGVETDVEGVADRTLIRPGMRISVLYQIADGADPALGYDGLEVRIAP